MNNKLKDMLILFLFALLQGGYSLPQGFFSQGLSIPKIVSWNGNDRTLAILPNVKVASPIKSSHINVFGKKTTEDKNSKKEQLPINDKGKNNDELKANQKLPILANQEVKTDQNIPNKDVKTEHKNVIQDVRLPNDLKQGEQLDSKFSDFDDIAPDYQNGSNELTTELLTETTTDSYETTTFEDDVFNRASPQLVASLLG